MNLKRATKYSYKDKEKQFLYLEFESGKVFHRGTLNDCYYLFFFLSGNVEIVYESQPTLFISEGHSIFLTPLSNYSITTLTPVKVLMIGFNSTEIGYTKSFFKNFSAICSLLKYEFHSLKVCGPIDLYLESVLGYLQDGISNNLLYSKKVVEIFVLFYSSYNLEDIAMFFYPLAEKNIEFRKMVLEYYAKANSINEYASLCGYSSIAFQRKFKEVFGETVYQWMQKQKAEQIKHCLMVSDISLKELAEKFDFTSPAHLNKFCRIWFGMTPSELQQTFLLRKNLNV